jgi:hypothetical protein
MNTIAEIEAAIENLPKPQVDELAAWLEDLRARRAVPRQLIIGLLRRVVQHVWEQKPTM